MRFNNHSDLAGSHAFLSASKSHWIGYDDDKFDLTYKTRLAAMKGTELHEFARQAIMLGQKLARSRKTMNLYINDAIGFRMIPEQVLYYSRNSFGTADAISFRQNGAGNFPMLRIHDLKTGVTKSAMRQLEVYVALFCLEYQIKPGEIEIELRIYQNDDVIIHIPELDDILHIMDRIITLDKRINLMNAEVLD